MLNPGRETARVTRGGASGLRGEELFGDAFDGKVVGRFLVFVKPYKRVLAVAKCRPLPSAGLRQEPGQSPGGTFRNG